MIQEHLLIMLRQAQHDIESSKYLNVYGVVNSVPLGDYLILNLLRIPSASKNNKAILRIACKPIITIIPALDELDSIFKFAKGKRVPMNELAKENLSFSRLVLSSAVKSFPRFF